MTDIAVVRPSAHKMLAGLVLDVSNRQSIVIETERAEATGDEPFAMLSTSSHVGASAADRVSPPSTTHVVTLAFDRDIVVSANAGGPLVCSALTDLHDVPCGAYQTLTDFNSALLVNATKNDGDAKDGYQAAA